MNEDSTTLEDAIEAVVERVLYTEVSTFFPAKIIKVKPSPINSLVNIVDCESAFLKIDPETNKRSPRLIQNIPLLMPGRTNTFIIRPPTDDISLLEANVGLLVSNSYLGNWKKTGGTVLPTDGRKFHYADAVAIFGLYPDITGWSIPPKDNTAEIKVLSGTKLEIGSEAADILKLQVETLTLLDTLLTKLSGNVDSVGSSSTGTNSLILADLAQMIIDNAATKVKLETLTN